MTQALAANEPITLRLNGEPRVAAAGTTLAALLGELGLDPRLVVVELNGEIRRDRGAFAATLLHHGDVLEVVHFVGGG